GAHNTRETDLVEARRTRQARSCRRRSNRLGATPWNGRRNHGQPPSLTSPERRTTMRSLRTSLLATSAFAVLLRRLLLRSPAPPLQGAANSTQSGYNVSVVDIATVPAGYRLAIEFVSMVGQVPPTQHVEILQITTVTDPFGGVSHDLLVNAQPAAVIGDALFRASQEVKLYANPGTTVRALFRRNSSAGDATFGVRISGRLVPVVWPR